MNQKRVPLYDRLPEIYRIRDAEQLPPGQLQAYLAAVEEVFGAVHENIESLYHDLFIETCDEWVIPYHADLLGTSHLKGEPRTLQPRTLRADVADTIALRRRKGTLGAIELLTHNLTGWAAHAFELRENLSWNQHLNHQRPDAGGNPPYADGTPGRDRFTVSRGGTIPVRDPAMLTLLYTPFDPMAHVADVKPATPGGIHYNLPNLAIFLWRLKGYRIGLSQPLSKGFTHIAGASGNEAEFAVYFDLHPLDRPVRLFNTFRYDPNRRPLHLTELDATPSPILPARLNSRSQAGNPSAYVSVDTYDPATVDFSDFNLTDVGLQLFLPETTFGGNEWAFRGENLCAWETGLKRPLQNREIAIDPIIGRVMFGVATAAERNALIADLVVAYTYGAVGPVGAHPIVRSPRPTELFGEAVDLRIVNSFTGTPTLQDVLANIHNAPRPIVIEIQDSLVHDLDLAALAGTINEDGGANLRLNRSLIIRSASGHRPIIRLARPLRFRPTRVFDPDPAVQVQLDAIIDRLTVRFEGIYLTRTAGFPGGQPLIARAAVARLEILNSTFDPGGFRRRDGSRAPVFRSLALAEPYGFSNANDEIAFKPTPEIHFQLSMGGSLLIGEGYRLYLTDSILDAGRGVGDPLDNVFAISSGSDPVNAWGPPTDVRGATFFGRVRVARIQGQGGIWTQRLEVHNNQTGCLKFSYFSGDGDRLPPHHACVFGDEARLAFAHEWFEQPAYGQLLRVTDFRIRERGPRHDAMGSFGFQLDAHKWTNINIRFREFMPVGIRPLLIPVT